MIVSAYGLPGMTAVELSGMLAGLGITFGVVNKGAIQKHKGTWPTQVLFPVIFTSATTFLHTSHKFKSSRVVAFVLDNPFVLDKELSLPLLGVEVLGTRTTDVPFGLPELKKILGTDVFLSTPQEYRRVPYTPVTEVMARYSASDLGKLQTFLYRIRDTEKRKKVGRAAKLWIVSNKPIKALESEIGRSVDANTWKALKNILTSDTILTLRTAISRVKAKPKAIDRIAKELKISPFDIRYLMATK